MTKSSVHLLAYIPSPCMFPVLDIFINIMKKVKMLTANKNARSN